MRLTAGTILAPGTWHGRAHRHASPRLEILKDDGCRCSAFLEVGGHPSLEGMIQHGARALGKTIVSACSVRRRASFEAREHQTLSVLENAGTRADRAQT